MLISAVFDVTVVDINHFIAGFMFGMTGDNNLTEIEACFQGGELMTQEIETGIADIKKGGWDNDTQAALQFGLVALQIPQALSTCKGMDADIAAIEDWAQIFTNPTELAADISKHYLFHKAEIQADIASVEADWDAGLFFKSGQDLAALMTVAVGPIVPVVPVTEMLPPLNAVPEFTAGLIFGFTGTNHLDELNTCMKDVDPLIKDVQAAFDDIKSGKLIAGIESIGNIFWLLPDAVSGCQGMDSDITAIETWAEIFKHPEALAKTVSKHWLFHGTEIKKEIADEKADWAAKKFFDAGDVTADILTALVGPVKPSTIDIPFLGISA